MSMGEDGGFKMRSSLDRDPKGMASSVWDLLQFPTADASSRARARAAQSAPSRWRTRTGHRDGYPPELTVSLSHGVSNDEANEGKAAGGLARGTRSTARR